MSLGEEEAKGGVGRVEAKENVSTRFFFGRLERCRATREEKRVGGVSGGRRQGPHYACLEGRGGEKGERGRSPAPLRMDAMHVVE